jgi:hypothetical protein
MSNGDSPGPSITATLAIPRDVLRVIAPPPETLSQRNVEAVTGIPSRVFLEAVRAPGFPLPVARLGKLRIVGRAAFVAWLQQGAIKPEAAAPSAAEDAPAEQEPAERADEILGAVGLKARAPARPSSPAPAASGRRARRP